MSDGIDIAGKIRVQLKDEFGKVKYDKTVHNSISNIGRQFFLHMGAGQILQHGSSSYGRSLFLGGTSEGKVTDSNNSNAYDCVLQDTGVNNLLNLNDGAINRAISNGGSLEIFNPKTDGNIVSFATSTPPRSDDLTAGHIVDSDRTSPLLQFCNAMTWEYGKGVGTGAINAIAMSNRKITGCPDMAQFKCINPGINKNNVLSGTAGIEVTNILPPGVVYNRGMSDEVVWSADDEMILLCVHTELSKPVYTIFDLNLTSGKLTELTNISDRYPEDIYPTVDRTVSWFDICFMELKELLAYVKIKNYYHLLIRRKSNSQSVLIGADKITKETNNISEVYGLTAGMFIYGGKLFVTDFKDDNSYVTLHAYNLRDDGKILYWDPSYETNTIVSVGNGIVHSVVSEIFNFDGMISNMPHVLKGKIVISSSNGKYILWSDPTTRGKLPSNVQNDTRYYLRVGYEFTNPRDIYGSLTGRIFSGFFNYDHKENNTFVFDTNKVSFSLTDEYVATLCVKNITAAGSIPQSQVFYDTTLWIAGPSWLGNIYSMRILPDTVVKEENDTLTITYIYSIGESSSIGADVSNRDGNNVLLPYI